MIIMYLNLLIGCDCTEDDLSEALSGKHPKTDATDDAAIFDKSKGLVLPVEDGHIRTVRRHPITCATTTFTYGSNTSRVMYSLGMRGN